MRSPATRVLNLNGPVPTGCVLNAAVFMSGMSASRCAGTMLVFCHTTRYGAKGSPSVALIVWSSTATELLDPVVARPAADRDLRIDHGLVGEHHVLGGEGLAVMPLHVGPKFDGPGQPVGRNAAVLLRRNLGREVGDELAGFVDLPERVEHRELDRRLHARVDVEQRIEVHGLLRVADHERPGFLACHTLEQPVSGWAPSPSFGSAENALATDPAPSAVPNAVAPASTVRRSSVCPRPVSLVPFDT